MGKTHSTSSIGRIAKHTLGVIGALHVYEIDAQKLRDTPESLVDIHVNGPTFVGFTMGGTIARWSYIPDFEIWIDKSMTDKDKAATVVHQYVEYTLMIEGTQITKNAPLMPYEKAHAQAERAEYEFRQETKRVNVTGDYSLLVRTARLWLARKGLI